MRWNYTEFEVSYQCLRDYYLVGGYYLSKLIKTVKEPDFTVEIDQPEHFWDELQIRFMATDTSED